MFADLEVTPDAYAATFKGVSDASKPAVKKERPTFPCQSCAGTGIYQATRVHQEKSHCFACGGKGHFATSEFDRKKARAAAAKRKQTKIEIAQEVFSEENPGFVAILVEVSAWNSFASSLKAQYDAKGALSEAQVNAVLNIKAKADATKARKAAEKAELSATVDLSSIHAMFDRAKESGLKKPMYRAEGMVLSLAKAGSVNAGSIYVKRKDGTYLGKVTGNEFKPSWEAKAEDKGTLAKIAANPSQVARDYGKRVGECSCCGRELTDPNSIAAGIGPICATGWGF